MFYPLTMCALQIVFMIMIIIYKVLFYGQITPNLLGVEWVCGLLQPGFVRCAPLLHITTLTTGYYTWLGLGLGVGV